MAALIVYIDVFLHITQIIIHALISTVVLDSMKMYGF